MAEQNTPKPDITYPVPPMHVLMPLIVYDNLQKRIYSLGEDYRIELKEKDREIVRLRAVLETKENLIKIYDGELEDFDKREKDLRMKLLREIEKNDSLKKELAELYDELGRTDEIKEVETNAVSEKTNYSL